MEWKPLSEAEGTGIGEVPEHNDDPLVLQLDGVWLSAEKAHEIAELDTWEKVSDNVDTAVGVNLTDEERMAVYEALEQFNLNNRTISMMWERILPMLNKGEHHKFTPDDLNYITYVLRDCDNLSELAQQAKDKIESYEY